MAQLIAFIKALIFLFLGSLLSCGNRAEEGTGLIKEVSSDGRQSTTDSALLFIDRTSYGASTPTFNFLVHDSLFFGQPISLSDTLAFIPNVFNTYLIQADTYQTPLLINAGDTLIFSKPQRVQQVLAKGTEEMRDEYNVFIQALILKYGALFPFVLDSPLQRKRIATYKALYDTEVYIHILHNDRLHFLHDYALKYNFSDSLKIECQKIIKLAAIDDSIALYRKNRRLVDKNQELMSRLATSLQKFDFESNYLFFMPYVNLVETATNIEGKLENIQQLDDVFRFVNKYIKGEAKAFLLGRYLYSGVEQKLVQDIQHYLNHIPKSSPYSLLVRNKIEALKHRDLSLQNDHVLHHESNESIALQSVLEKYRGHVVLVDFWASWCQPCIAEFPYAQNLKDRFDSEKFKIIYFSTDQDVDSWRSAMSRHSLPSEDSYLVGKENSVIQDLQIRSIPRYVLLNDLGKVMDASAPRPSDAALIRKIEQLLN